MSCALTLEDDVELRETLLLVLLRMESVVAPVPLLRVLVLSDTDEDLLEAASLLSLELLDDVERVEAKEAFASVLRDPADDIRLDPLPGWDPVDEMDRLDTDSSSGSGAGMVSGKDVPSKEAILDVDDVRHVPSGNTHTNLRACAKGDLQSIKRFGDDLRC